MTIWVLDRHRFDLDHMTQVDLEEGFFQFMSSDPVIDLLVDVTVAAVVGEDAIHVKVDKGILDLGNNF